MPNISRTKTWNANETLTAADLNAEYNGILTGVNDNALNNDNLNQTDDYLFGSLITGSGLAAAGGDGKLHVHVASAGSVAAHANGNDFVIEGTANPGMSFLSGASTTNSIYFGDVNDNDAGSIVYTHGADMAFTVETAEVLSLSASTITASADILAASSSANEPVLTLQNTHNGATSAYLKFVNDKGAAGADNDVCGTIAFYGDDDNQDNIEFARIEGVVADASNGDECGAIKLYVAENDGNNTVGLALVGSTTDGEVDVTVGAGSASVVTIPGHIDLAGDIDVDGTLEADAITIGSTDIGSIYGVVAGSSSIVTTGALNSGSITSGFANINNGSSTLDTGAATLASLTCTAAGTFGGGYGATGATISTAGVIQANGAITSDGAVTGATLAGTVSTATQNSITTATSLASVGTITSGTWSGVIDGSCTMTVGSDATGDVYFRDASGFLERLAASTDGHVLTSTGAGSIPAWEALPAGTSLSGSTNNTIVTVTGANAMLGEANLTFDGTTLEVVNDGSAAQLKLTDNGVGYATIESDNRTILIGENGNAAVQIGDGSANYPMYIGDTANGNMTTGITINQGAADDELFALKSSDVAHGMTGQTETDTYGYIKKFSATLGGVKFGGLSESATAMELTANATTPQTTDTTGSEGIFHFRANKANGTAVQDLGDTDNLCCMVNNNTTRFVLKGNGTLHITNTTLVALDFEDDNQLVRAMQRESSVEGSLLESEYDNPFYSHSKLMEHGLAGEKDEKGEFFVPLQNRLHAHEGAMWQTYCEVKDMKMKIEERDTKIAALEQRLNLIESN